MHRRDFLRISLQAAVTPPVSKAKITSSVLLSTLKGSFDERVAAAARSGVQSIELTDEYKGWSDADIARVKRMVRSYNMTIDAITGGSEYARRLDVPQVIADRPAPQPDLTVLLTSLPSVKQANDPRIRLLFEIDRNSTTQAVTEAAPYTGVYRVTAPPAAEIYKAMQKANFTGYLCIAYATDLIQALNNFRAALS